ALSGLLRVAAPAELAEDRVADLGPADSVRRTVEPAVSDRTLGLSAHPARHPLPPAGIGFHSLQLDGEKAVEVAGVGELGRQAQSQDAVGLIAATRDQSADGLRRECNQLEPVCANRRDGHSRGRNTFRALTSALMVAGV